MQCFFATCVSDIPERGRDDLLAVHVQRDLPICDLQLRSPHSRFDPSTTSDLSSSAIAEMTSRKDAPSDRCMTFSRREMNSIPILSTRRSLVENSECSSHAVECRHQYDENFLRRASAMRASRTARRASFHKHHGLRILYDLEALADSTINAGFTGTTAEKTLASGE